MRSSNTTSRRPHRRKVSATSDKPVARHRPPVSLLIVVAILVMLGTAMGQTSRGAMVSPPGEGSPELIAEARKHFRLGLQLYNEGNGRAALIEMRRAYEIAPSPRLLYNIGQAAADAKDYAAAFDALSLYLERGGTDLNEQRREQVEKDLEQIRGRVGFLRIETNVANPEVLVDGLKVDLSERLLVTVEPGRHEVTVQDPDGTPLTRQWDVPALDTVLVRMQRREAPPIAVARAPSALASAPALTLVPAAPMTAEKRSPVRTEPAKHHPSLAPWAWATAIAAGGFGLSGLATGLLSAKAEDDHTKLLGTVPGDRAAIEDSARRVKTLALATDVLVGASLAAALATVTFVLLDPRDGSTSSVRGNGLHLRLGAGHAVVEGRF